MDAWPRRDHFAFFCGYEQPFFNVCVDVEVGSLLSTCRAPDGPSFFLSTMYASMRAANDVESFRYRIRGERVVVHDVVHAGSAVLIDDERFGFAYFAFTTEFAAFLHAGKAAVAGAGDASLDDYADRDDLTYHSVLPWIPFTSFAHARRGGAGDSIPRVVLGGYRGSSGTERMPVSVEVHHALMDGIHVSRYLDRFQMWIDALAAGEGSPATDASAG